VLKYICKCTVEAARPELQNRPAGSIPPEDTFRRPSLSHRLAGGVLEYVLQARTTSNVATVETGERRIG